MALTNRELLRADRRARPWLPVTVALGGLGALVAVGQAVLLSRAVGLVFLHGAGLATIGPLLAGLAGLAALRAALTWASEVSGQRLASRVKLALRERLAAHLLALGPAYAEGERSGELATTTLGGVEALDEYLSQYLPQITLAALSPMLVLAWVLPADPLSGLVLLLTAPLIPLFMWLIGGLAREQTARQWRDLRLLGAHFLDTLQGLPTLKLFGRSREQLEAVGQISARFGKVTLEVLRVAFLSALALELIASLSTALLAVAIGLRLLEGRMAFEPALAVLILAPEFYLPLRLLGQRHHAGMAGKEALGRIAAILDTPAPAAPVAPAPPPMGGEIVFSSVRYAYDGGSRPALRGLDLRIPAGRTVALVGPSGGGKSTVAQLLLGFRAPDAGAITVGGVPLASFDPAAWRERVAWVGQRPALFPGSVAENLRLARPAASDAELEAAARAAEAHAFIAALPQGYATPIGEGGARLSGGQRQRLAIARALLKDAPVLILDEATAHLDAASEAAVRAALRRLLGGRTALVIAHRLEVAMDADSVAVLRDGRVVEEGPPEALLARRGAFFQLREAYDAVSA